MPEITKSNKLILSLLIACVSALSLMATDIYTPAMPAVGKALGASDSLVQLTITVFLIATALSQLVYGPLSDYYGRKPVLIAGILIYALGSVLCAAMPNISGLLIGRFIQGVGTGAILVLNRVILKDVFSGAQLAKMISYIAMVIAVSPIIAPVLGGFIELHWGWRWIFVFLLLYSLIIAGWAWIKLNETNPTIRQNPLSFPNVLHNYRSILKHHVFWAHALPAGIAFATIMTTATVNPYLFENQLGQTAAEYGVWAMIGSMGFLLGMGVNANGVRWLGPERMLTIGNFLLLAMSLLWVISGYLNMMSIPVMLIPTMGISFAIAFVFPNAFVGGMAPFSGMVGAASALYGCSQIAISFGISLITAAIDETTQLPMGVLLFSLAVISLLAYRLLNTDYYTLKRNKIISPS